MNLVDSSGWLAFLADSANAEKFAEPIQDIGNLLVPSIVIYEVTEVLMREKGADSAIVAQAHLQQGSVVDLTASLACNAALISLQFSLPMADSIILATARKYNAVVWTQDSDFEGREGVIFFPA
ncbi:MAG: PIN domain-containing protein [Chitinivibrionales bacterium]|nr:PIN domain-containing protein [Chitinivibrionales bacterium]